MLLDTRDGGRAEALPHIFRRWAAGETPSPPRCWRLRKKAPHLLDGMAGAVDAFLTFQTGQPGRNFTSQTMRWPGSKNASSLPHGGGFICTVWHSLAKAGSWRWRPASRDHTALQPGHYTRRNLRSSSVIPGTWEAERITRVRAWRRPSTAPRSTAIKKYEKPVSVEWCSNAGTRQARQGESAERLQ